MSRPETTRCRSLASPVLGLVVVLGLAAVGCAGASSPSSAPPSPSTSGPTGSTVAAPGTTAPAALPFAAGDTYVALGSSIASGYGISVQSTSCGRSSRNYPQLLAARHALALTDVSCGAAVIPNLVDTPQGANPPQITAVTGDTKLITISVGGNDIGYNASAVACGDPATVCSEPPNVGANATTAKVALMELINRLRTIAPSATIVLVAYPREVPPGNCPALGFTDEEAAIVRSLGQQLESLLVDVGDASEVRFVDPYVEPGDHTGCAPEAERWTAGHDSDDGFAYHPTALGHEVMADMIDAALQRPAGG